MTNFNYIKAMSIDELTEWLDKHGQFDSSPWIEWFNQEYCQKCASIECTCADAEEKLGINPFYGDTVECAYCELADESGTKRCRFFTELDAVPDSAAIIKLWLSSQA